MILGRFAFLALLAVLVGCASNATSATYDVEGPDARLPRSVEVSAIPGGGGVTVSYHGMASSSSSGLKNSKGSYLLDVFSVRPLEGRCDEFRNAKEISAPTLKIARVYELDKDGFSSIVDKDSRGISNFQVPSRGSVPDPLGAWCVHLVTHIDKQVYDYGWRYFLENKGKKFGFDSLLLRPDPLQPLL